MDNRQSAHVDLTAKFALRGSKKPSENDDGKHHEHKEDHKPVQVMHGQDNRDKTVDEMQQGEEVPQVRHALCIRNISLHCLHCFLVLHGAVRGQDGAAR